MPGVLGWFWPLLLLFSSRVVHNRSTKPSYTKLFSFEILWILSSSSSSVCSWKLSPITKAHICHNRHNQRWCIFSSHCTFLAYFLQAWKWGMQITTIRVIVTKIIIFAISLSYHNQSFVRKLWKLEFSDSNNGHHGHRWPGMQWQGREERRVASLRGGAIKY